MDIVALSGNNIQKDDNSIVYTSGRHERIFGLGFIIETIPIRSLNFNRKAIKCVIWELNMRENM